MVKLFIITYHATGTEVNKADQRDERLAFEKVEDDYIIVTRSKFKN